jgi:hypothetical protein
MDTSLKLVQVHSPAMVESSLETGGMQGQIYKQHYVFVNKIVMVPSGSRRRIMAHPRLKGPRACTPANREWVIALQECIVVKPVI